MLGDDAVPKLNIKKTEFLKSFHVKYRLYLDLQNQENYITERRLLLFYCVECGLKVWIMKEQMLNDYNELEKYSKKNQLDIAGHNIRNMLKNRGLHEKFRLKDLKTLQGTKVPPKEYNQFWRYDAQSGDLELENKMEKVLKNIADYLSERL